MGEYWDFVQPEDMHFLLDQIDRERAVNQQLRELVQQIVDVTELRVPLMQAPAWFTWLDSARKAIGDRAQKEMEV